MSKSTVPRICAGIDEEAAVFRSRMLDHVTFPYVYLDATYIKARINHRIISRAVVVATGVTTNGDREVLGVDVGDSEDEVGWRLAGVRLAIWLCAIKRARSSVVSGLGFCGWGRWSIGCRVGRGVGVGSGCGW